MYTSNFVFRFVGPAKLQQHDGITKKLMQSGFYTHYYYFGRQPTELPKGTGKPIKKRKENYYNFVRSLEILFRFLKMSRDRNDFFF